MRHPAAWLNDPATSWEAIYLQGKPVGYQAARMRRATEDSSQFLDGLVQSRISVNRFGQAITEELQVASRESPEGDVERVETRVTSAGKTMRTVGRRVGNVLELETHADVPARWSLELPQPCGGYLAVEWSLRSEPLAAGQRRTLRAVMPVLNQVGQIELVARDVQLTSLLSERRPLLRIDQRITIPSSTATQTLDSVLWCETDGTIVKTEMPWLQQVSYRVDRQTALAQQQQPPQFDLGELATVQVARPFPLPHQSQRVKYRVRLERADPAVVFPEAPSQTVRPLDSHWAEITVRALRPGVPTQLDHSPEPRDLAPSAMIQSQDPGVLALKSSIVPAASDAWSIALATEAFVFRTINRKDFSTALATAADVAASRQGDCTEHAVLTAALCRAQQVPARVVVGLVFVAAQQSFVCHMWNEVWTGTQWIPIDATLGQGGIGAAHLLLARSALDHETGLASLLPVIDVLGQLEIEIVEIE
jgi:transglutaminase-like putative cysteine protease